jgi:hypothetical protein
MDPILLIHGYSSEGKDNKAKDIYGSLPAELRKLYGKDNVNEINLSRWISLSDGVTLDDVSFAMDRALKADHADLLQSGFHVIIHSTGALVVRNWIKKFSPKPSPINNLIHLAGANFGSGLAHIGKGQLSRWGRLIFSGTGRGTQVLDELEFGSWKTIDLHLHFLQPGNDMLKDYQVQEFCIIGSQTLSYLRAVPIRYVKEDSADNTVRTSAGNLNFNYIAVNPRPRAFKLGVRALNTLINKRLNDEQFKDLNYDFDLGGLSQNRTQIPFAVAYETAHFGSDIGIVSGSKNRAAVMPLIRQGLNTRPDASNYQKTVEQYQKAMDKTFARAAKLKSNLFEWDKQQQYEGHAQLIFRIKDQFGKAVEHFDVRFNSSPKNRQQNQLEKMIEDQHTHEKDKGSTTFYLRTQKFDKSKKQWKDLLTDIAEMDVEITGLEAESSDISYVPMNLHLSSDDIKAIVQSFRTTIIDITLLRLPSEKVFEVSKG